MFKTEEILHVSAHIRSRSTRIQNIAPRLWDMYLHDLVINAKYFQSFKNLCPYQKNSMNCKDWVVCSFS